MTNTLDTIQKATKIFGIVVKVLMVCMFVAAGLTLIAGIVCICADNSEVFNAVKDNLVKVEGTVDPVKFGMACIAEAFNLAAQAVSFLFFMFYFNVELKEGTPFGAEGPKKLFIAGIASLIATAVSGIAAGTITAINELNGYSLDFGDTAGAGLGLFALLVAMILKYGAERELVRGGMPEQAENRPEYIPQTKDEE